MMYKKGDMKMMTWNIYIGASLEPLINTTKEELPIAMTEVFKEVVQTDFEERARSIARIIKEEDPDFIGLQEVAQWTIETACSKCVMNFLSILLDELYCMGKYYCVAAVNRDFSFSYPDACGNIISLVNRDVILFKKDLPLEITNIQEKNFVDNLVAQIGGEPFTFLRGYSSVDIRLCDKKFRFVNTRLEASEDADDIRLKQTQQLLEDVDDTSLPVFLSGSFSILPDEQLYDLYTDQGYKDAWAIKGQGPGYTAFQASDLMNPVSTLSYRFEYIFFRGYSQVQCIFTEGDQQRDRTRCGLWPSDHAGIYGIFELPLWA